MPEPAPPQSSNLPFKVITAIAVALLLYIGACGARLSLHKYGDQGIYIPNSLILLATGILMVIVVAAWLVLRAVLRKDKP